MGQPIPLGYAVAVAIGFFLYLKRVVASATARNLALALLVAGILASISRGPWVGAAVVVLVFFATGRAPMLRLTGLGVLALAVLSVMLVLPGGDTFITKLIDLLPFVGTVDAINVAYRQRLFEIAIQIILQNPLFGNPGFYHSSAMSELMHDGFIDLLNTPMSIGMSGGLIALSLFGGFFIVALLGIFTSMRRITDRSSERHLLGQALLASLLGALAIIFTVSPISCIPVIYWTLGGLGVAYARMPAREKAPEPALATGNPGSTARPFPRPPAGIGSHGRYRNQPPRSGNG